MGTAHPKRAIRPTALTLGSKIFIQSAGRPETRADILDAKRINQTTTHYGLPVLRPRQGLANRFEFWGKKIRIPTRGWAIRRARNEQTKEVVLTAVGQPRRSPTMTDMTDPGIPMSEQLEALATRQVYALMKKHGIKTIDPRKHLTLTRSDVLDYFRHNRGRAESLVTDSKNRPFHDVLCLERRGKDYVIFDMDHGIPRSEMLYGTLEEAATDFVAFTIGYGYQEGYGFRK